MRTDLETGERTASALATGRARLLLSGILFAAAIVVVAGRLIGVSTSGAPESPRAAGPERTAGTDRRADITDRNGTLLATSLTVASAYAVPREIRDRVGAARKLAGVLTHLDPDRLAAQLDVDSTFVYIARGLTPTQHSRVLQLGIPGIYFQDEVRRFYPQGRLVSHLVGFSDIDSRGLAGVEQQFDTRLASGPRPLALSIDIRAQHIMRQAMASQIMHFGALGGAGVMLDVDSGEVLAMVSLPDFEPLAAGRAPADSRRNGATLSTYELGSIFKIFTTALVLDEQLATTATMYDARRPLRFGRFTIRDFHAKERWMSVAEILMHSSNVGSVQMALHAGTGSQRRFLKDLGLFDLAPVELPERGLPQVPPVWRPINTVTASYGHGIAVSLLHMTRAVSAVVNGGILRPVTVLRRPDGVDPGGEQVISPATSHEMRKLLRLVVEKGTGRKGNARGFLVGGKTGTADKPKNGRYNERARIASFVAAFPMDRPRYALAVMIDDPQGRQETQYHATGGWVAAPVVRDIIRGTAPILGLDPVDESAPEIVEAFNVELPGPEQLEGRVRGERVALRTHDG